MTPELSAIKEILHKNKKGKSFTLKADDFPSGSIREILAMYFGSEELVFLDSTVQDETDQLTVTAHLQNTFMGTSNLAASLTFSAPNGHSELKAVLSGFPQDWKIADAFGQLKDSLIDEFDFLKPAFTLDSEKKYALPEDYRTQLGIPAALPIDTLQVKKGLSFSASIISTKLSKSLAWILTDPDHTVLKLTGPIEIVQGYPVQWLQSDNGKKITLFGKDLPLVLELVAIRTAENMQNQQGDLLSFGQVTANVSYDLSSGRQTIGFRGRFLHQNMLVVQCNANTSAAKIGFNISDLAAITGIKEIASLIPTSFPFASIKLLGLGVDLFVPDQSIDNPHVVVGAKSSWQPFGDWLTFNDFTVAFFTGPTLESTAVNAFTTATVLGQSIDATVSLPNLGFSLMLGAGQEIDIDALLAGLAIQMPGLKGTKCSAFNLTGNIEQSFYSSFCQLKDVWEIDLGGGRLSINAITLQVSHSGDGNSAFLEGEVQIGDFDFQLVANHDVGAKGWLLLGQSLNETPMPLQEMAAAIGDLLGMKVDFPLAAIALKGATITLNTNDNSFRLFADTDFTIKLPFFGNSVEVETVANLESYRDTAQDKRIYTGYFEADLMIGAAKFTARFAMADKVESISGSWSSLNDETLGLEDLVSFLGISNSIEIPPGLDLALTTASFTYNISQERFTLAAQSKNYGDSFFTVGKDDTQNLAFVFGITLPQFHRLSNIPGIGKFLKPADFINFEQVGIMITSGNFKDYLIPQLPPLTVNANLYNTAAQGTISKPITPIAAQSKLTLAPGISLATELGIEALAASDKKFKNLLSIINKTNLVLQVVYSKMDLRLFMGLDSPVGIPDGKGETLKLEEVHLRIDLTEEVIIQLLGKINFTIFTHDIETTARLILDESEAQVSVNLESDNSLLPLPKGLKGFTLKDFGVELGVFFEPPGIDFGLEGKIEISEQINSNDSFSIILQMVEGIPNPLYLAFSADEINMGTALSAFTNINDVDIVKALNVVKATNVSFYWAENIVVLPDGSVAQPGLGFSAGIKVFGFGFMGEFAVALADGVSGKSESGPVNLKNILSLTGDGKGVYRNYEEIDGIWKQVSNNSITPQSNNKNKKETIIAPGGPVLNINSTSTPFPHINIKASLFDIVAAKVEASIGLSGIVFSLDFQLADIEDFTLTCTLKNWSSFTGQTTLKISINKDVGPIQVAGVDCGSVKLNVQVNSGITISLSPEMFSLTMMNTSFDFEGQRILLPEIKLTTAPKSLAGLPGVISSEIEKGADTYFDYLFNKAEKWADSVVSGVITGVDDMANSLKTAYKKTAAETARIMKSAGETTGHVASGLKEAYELSYNGVATTMKGAGYAAQDVGNAFDNSFRLSANDTAKALHAAGYSAKKTADVMRHVFGSSAKTVTNTMKDVYNLEGKAANSILKEAGYSSSEIKNALKSIFDWPPKIPIKWPTIPSWLKPKHKKHKKWWHLW